MGPSGSQILKRIKDSKSGVGHRLHPLIPYPSVPEVLVLYPSVPLLNCSVPDPLRPSIFSHTGSDPEFSCLGPRSDGLDLNLGPEW